MVTSKRYGNSGRSIHYLFAAAFWLMGGSTADRVLTLKARRAQIQARVEEWEATFRRVHGHDADEVERHRSSQYRELSRLLSDIDGFVQSMDSGNGISGQGTRQASSDAERRAGRGRTKARMRQWDREFERTHHRKPTEHDHRQSNEFAELQVQLHDASASPSTARGTGAEAQPTDELRLPGPESNQMREGGLDTPVDPLPDAIWWQGSDYYELLRSRVRSQSSVNGFVGATMAEVSGHGLHMSTEEPLTHM